MSISVNLNPAAAAAQAYARAQASGTQAIMQLSSGRRINSAADDAAGLAISVHLTSHVQGLEVGARNAQDAVSLTQTADGALGSIAGNLQRLRELAVQSANATNSSADRAALQAEAAQLVNEIDRVSTSTRFNGIALLDGSFGQASFQVGADAGQTIGVGPLASARAAVLGNPLATRATLSGSTLTAASTITGPGQLVINGVDVWRGSPIAADAAALAAAINAAGITGLNASAAATVAVGSYAALGSQGQFAIDDQGTLNFDHSALTPAAAIQDTVNLINGGTPNLLVDGGFEDTDLGPASYVYGPSDEHPWQFISSGVTSDHSGFTNGNAPIPEGNVAAFVQNTAVLSQTFNVTNGGSYDLGFQIVRRLNQGVAQTVAVMIDGQQVMQVAGPDNWTQISLPAIALGTGSHTISFVGSATLDGTAFLDDIQLTAAGAQPARRVVASNNGSGVTLTAADGSNIGLDMLSGQPQIAGLGGIAYGTASDGITYSHVDLAYAGPSALSVGGTMAAALGLGGAPQVQSSGNFVASIDLSTVDGANLALDAVDSALGTVDGQRALLGAAQNRLGAAITSTQADAANTSAALSRIVDADYGQAISTLTRANILQQAGLAMIAQANLHASDVLRLLRT